MKRLLLIVDLEGIAGVESLAQLIAGGAGYDTACSLLTDEVNAAVEGFIAAGYDEVLISDSHRGGAAGANVIESRLHRRARLHAGWDAYDPALFAEADAVACIGMHARAGTSGFIAHTVGLHCEWRLDGRPLSETDIVIDLAAAAACPIVYVAGDDVLCAALAGRVTAIETKTCGGLFSCRSRLPEEVRARLQAAAALRATLPTSSARTPLEIRFKSRWQADIAVTLGARRSSLYGVTTVADEFRHGYRQAAGMVEATAGPILTAVRGTPGSDELLADVAELIARPVVGIDEECRPLVVGNVEETLAAFLRWTDTPSDFSRALRALLLHMAEGWAPRVFARLHLRPVLYEAVAALRSIPMRLAPDVRPFDGMSRIDAWYILRERGLPCEPADREELRQYIEHLHALEMHAHAWMLGEMAATQGVDVRLAYPWRPYRQRSRLVDLYWLTHEFLFATHYMRLPLSVTGWESRIEELFMATPWLIEHGHVDLAAEVALCLQMVGEQASIRHRQLVEFLLSRQREDGVLLDGSMGDAPEIMADHATGLLFLVQAGAEEWNLKIGGRSAGAATP
jgi:D-amino peptidase